MAPQLEYLEQVRHNLEYADFNMIQLAIAELRDKFLPIAILKKGFAVDRVRINRPGEIFNGIDAVNYITDKAVLDQHADFGRANLRKEAMFYGSVETPQIRLPRYTAWRETTAIFDTQPLPDELHETFTLSRWRVKETFEIVEMIFSDEALIKSDYTKASLEHQTKGIADLRLEQHYRDQGRFFSNEFARNDCKGKPSNYKISAAYANYVLTNLGFLGITFPSVQSEYQGQNIVLRPEAVDKYLELEKVAMFKFDREKGQNLPLDSIKLANELGDDKMNFQWFDYIGREHQ